MENERWAHIVRDAKKVGMGEWDNAIIDRAIRYIKYLCSEFLIVALKISDKCEQRSRGTWGKGSKCGPDSKEMRYWAKSFFRKLSESFEDDLYGLKGVSRELQLLKRFAGHPSFPKLYGLWFDEEDKCFVMAMEWATNGSLESWLCANRECLPFKKKKENQQQDESIVHTKCAIITIDVLFAFVSMHAQRFNHRDVKPGNIIITDNSNGDDIDIKAMICDFGAGKNADDGSLTFGPSGNGATISPEAWRREEYGPKGDVYSFAITLFRMTFGIYIHNIDTQMDFINGRRPVLQQFMSQRPKDGSDPAELLLNFIFFCMEPDARLRPSSTEFLMYFYHNVEKVFPCADVGLVRKRLAEHISAWPHMSLSKRLLGEETDPRLNGRFLERKKTVVRKTTPALDALMKEMDNIMEMDLRAFGGSTEVESQKTDGEMQIRVTSYQTIHFHTDEKPEDTKLHLDVKTDAHIFEECRAGHIKLTDKVALSKLNEYNKSQR